MTAALITGITGQVGSYLAESMLADGYEVHGLIRRCSTFPTERIEHIFDHPKLRLHYGDLLDSESLLRLLVEIKPDQIYNLAAQSHVGVSFTLPVHTSDVVGLGALRLFEAVRLAGIDPFIYQASTSELFGGTPPPQNENSPMEPRSPYAAAKLFAYHTAKTYRQAYGMRISNGIMFNAESPRRLPTFVTRKITLGLARISQGIQDKLVLGPTWPERDWGWAPDYVRALRLMADAEPSEFVIATGQSRSVEEFLAIALDVTGVDPARVVLGDRGQVRPLEVEALRGDATKAREQLGWAPEVDFKTLVQRMIEHDLALAFVEARGGRGKVV